MRGNECGLDPLTTSVYAGDAAENCAWTMLMANNNTFRSKDANEITKIQQVGVSEYRNQTVREEEGKHKQKESCNGLRLSVHLPPLPLLIFEH